MKHLLLALFGREGATLVQMRDELWSFADQIRQLSQLRNKFRRIDDVAAELEILKVNFKSIIIPKYVISKNFEKNSEKNFRN